MLTRLKLDLREYKQHRQTSSHHQQKDVSIIAINHLLASLFYYIGVRPEL